MRKRIGVLVAAVWVAGGVSARAGAQACGGDCDGNRAVSVSEIVTGVNVALGAQPAEACAALDTDGDRLVAINELIAAVGGVLDGCALPEVSRAAVVRGYAERLFANYADAVAGAVALRDAVEAFLAAPGAVTLQAARQAWLDARPAYLQTEMARFYNGPIDNDQDGPEPLINSWPLDESFIDYVIGVPNAGIVNHLDLFPLIDADVISGENGRAGEDEITTGYHAIEFLLWGQDRDPHGPGQRPFTDYVDGGTAANQARRGVYLRTAAALLVADLTQVRDAWAPDQQNYRAAFVTLDSDEALRRMFTGLGSLSGGELTGERLSTAYETKDQEDEHSCFSDNTHIDHRYDEIGIQNAFFGRYHRLGGAGLIDLVAAVNPDLAARTRAAMAAALQAFLAIPVPFDQAILGSDDAPGRVAIKAAIDALNAQTDLIAECAATLGIQISTTGP